jgi:hypothetical protein
MRVRWIVGIVIVLAAAYLGLRLLANMDIVTNDYASMEQARADRLFERGWLPDILPASARDTRTSNDVDTNMSEGRFNFLAADYAAFTSRLRPYSSSASPYSRYIEEMQGRGYEARLFSDDTSTWAFLCNGERGYCEYRMWVDTVAEPAADLPSISQ